MWYVSETLINKKSRFQARCCKIDKEADIKQNINLLLSLEKSIAKATHPAMYAWRIQDPQTKNFSQGSEDGGEKGAGQLLLSLLEKIGVVNMLLIVTRWKGGPQIGSSRFRHISKVAGDVLRASNDNKKK